jgi:hypothetical protein
MEPRMNYRLGFRSWAAGALVLAAVTACNDSGSDPGPISSPTSASSTPIGPASTMSPTDVASTNATDVVRRYYAVLDEVRQNPKLPISKLRQVETGVELDADIRLVRSERSKDLRQIGSAKLVEVKAQSVNLDNSDPRAGKVPTVVVDVCWDVSAVDVVDRSGKSVVTPTRPDQGRTRYMVANYRWTTDPTHGWRVASGQDLELAPCAAS